MSEALPAVIEAAHAMTGQTRKRDGLNLDAVRALVPLRQGKQGGTNVSLRERNTYCRCNSYYGFSERSGKPIYSLGTNMRALQKPVFEGIRRVRKISTGRPG